MTSYPETPVADTYFQLVTYHIPKHLEAQEYFYSIKYDGVRVRLNGTIATTRGGIQIDITGLALPFETTTVEYDAELIHVEKPGPNNVMIELNANRIEKLSVRVFDIIDLTRPFEERQASLLAQVEEPYRVLQHPLRDREHLTLVIRAVLSTGAEGVVVRNRRGFYVPGRRSRRNAFKVKRLL